jgi:hypothetical protein
MSATESKEAQKLLARTDVDLKAAEARAKAEDITKLRDTLQVDYQRLLSDANPHLNYITTRLNKHKGGSLGSTYLLWSVHFSIGDNAKVVSVWIERNQSELTRAGILRVGVRSSESWGG